MLAQLDLDQIQNIGLPTFVLRGGGRTSPTLATVINAVLPYVFGAAGIALLIYLVLGGFQLMLSKGDPKAIQSAQSKITNALIGFVIIILAVAIVQIVGGIFNITQFGDIFGR